MIIVDTSVWIEFLRGGFMHHERLCEAIEIRNVLMLECIAAELLQGAKGRREINVILQYWQILPNISMDNLWIEAGEYASVNILISKGIGIIDAVILCAAVKTGSKIWTLDKKLLAISSERVYIP